MSKQKTKSETAIGFNDSKACQLAPSTSRFKMSKLLEDHIVIIFYFFPPLDQWFSNFSKPQNHLDSAETQTAKSYPRIFDSTELRGPGDADTMVW